MPGPDRHEPTQKNHSLYHPNATNHPSSTKNAVQHAEGPPESMGPYDHSGHSSRSYCTFNAPNGNTGNPGPSEPESDALFTKLRGHFLNAMTKV